MSYQTEREEFLVRLAHELPTVRPTVVLDAGRAILRAAQQLQNYAVYMCNRDITPRDEAAAVRAEKRLRDAVADLPGVSVASIGRDPRGYVVKLRLPSGRGNTWGGDAEGWWVPARG